MTTALRTPTHRMSPRLRYLPIGIAASVLQGLIMIPGYNDDGTWDNAWFSMLVMSLIVATVVFIFVVPNGGAVSALVLGILSLLGAVAFWAMFSFPIAAGAGVLGLRARREGSRRTMANVALGLAAFAVAATVAITIGDAISN